MTETASTMVILLDPSTNTIVAIFSVLAVEIVVCFFSGCLSIHLCAGNYVCSKKLSSTETMSPNN